MDDEHSCVAARLVARIKAGDATAEDEFVLLYSGPIQRMLRLITGNAYAADDLHQETFAIVLCRLRQRGLRDPARLGQFVRQTARKLSLSHGRQQRGWRERAINTEEVEMVVDPAPGPLALVIHDEARALVLRAIERVRPERYRQILRHYYIEEESKETICAALGLSDRHFHRVLFRARRRFRDELPDELAILFSTY